MQGAHAPVGLELQTSEGQSDNDAKTSIKGEWCFRRPAAASFARGGWSNAIDILLWHPIMASEEIEKLRLEDKSEKTDTADSRGRFFLHTRGSWDMVILGCRSGQNQNM